MIIGAQSSRWLVAVIVALVVVAATAIATTLTVGRAEPAELPADTPEGTVQRYLLAIVDRDYDAAHALLAADLQEGCSAAELRLGARQYEDFEFTARLAGTRVVGEETEVTVRVSERSDPPPFGPGESTQTQHYRLSETPEGWRLEAVDFPMPFCIPKRPTPPMVPALQPVPAEPSV